MPKEQCLGSSSVPRVCRRHKAVLRAHRALRALRALRRSNLFGTSMTVEWLADCGSIFFKSRESYGTLYRDHRTPYSVLVHPRNVHHH